VLTKRRSGRQWRVRPGTPSPLGQKIRAARKELGLTLTAVAGHDFSRAFLSQVELGRARPSTETLRIIAQRLQRPIDYFLDDADTSSAALELALAEAEVSLHRGDVVRSEALLRRILSPSVPLELKTRAQLTLAAGHLKQGQAEQAIHILDEALATAERSGWDALVVELSDRMGSAYYLLRRPHDAGRWFDRALDRYQAASLTDPVLRARILGHRANLHYVTGEPVEAISGYQSAIAAAERVLDMPALAGIYEGLALSLQETGQYARALSYAQKSLRIFETLRDVRMTGQLRSNMGEMLLRQGRAAEAERSFKEGVDLLRPIGERRVLPLLITGMSESALEQGALDRAATLIDEGLQLADGSTDPIAKVAAHRVAGRVAVAQGRRAQAHEHFGQAIAVAETIASPELRARAAYDFARALEDEGDVAGAALRFRQAYEAGRATARASSALSDIEN
jgi:tetratricopeptide (TPR) repeat protein